VALVKIHVQPLSLSLYYEQGVEFAATLNAAPLHQDKIIKV